MRHPREYVDQEVERDRRLGEGLGEELHQKVVDEVMEKSAIFQHRQQIDHPGEFERAAFKVLVRRLKKRSDG